LSEVENLVFFPQWIESYNRVSIEARILGCKIITNKLIGAASEEYFKLKGKDLLQFIKENNKNVIRKILDVVEGKEPKFHRPYEVPKVSFLTSLYKGAEHIEGFLKNITSVYLFETSEVVIYDSCSPEEEFKLIEPYLKKYKNIKYKRLEKNYLPSKVYNKMIEECEGEFLTTAPVDDRVGYNYLRHTIKNLIGTDESLALVYADCLQTRNKNETLENNSSNRKMYEHSLQEFSKKNMVKSLPGPMPVWKKEIHSKIGLFREDIKYPIDWEMWLRMVKEGYTFKKIGVVYGLYLFNEKGLTTSPENSKLRLEEEAKVYFEYSDIFGDNFEIYKPYFSQFLKKEGDKGTNGKNKKEKVSSDSIRANR
tara:strand:- start:49 stop:1146 length:1098 start_codon:yes stop_codon:yes gene_type:complete